MKTNTITLAFYSPSYNAGNMNRLTGHYKTDFETKQKATYSIADGIATITALEPLIATQVNLPLPYSVPVTDLGSGQLTKIDINADNLTPHPAICPTTSWAELRRDQPAPTIEQVLMADYIGLL